MASRDRFTSCSLSMFIFNIFFGGVKEANPANLT